jgi:glycerophosphoryl diester phosphodiesterase
MKQSSRKFHLLIVMFGLVVIGLALYNMIWKWQEYGTCIIELEPSNLFTTSNLQNNYEPYGYVAHALGSIDGYMYTNSREAFISSYEKGFRIFEVDMVLLKDRTVFCAHDGKEAWYGLDKKFNETTYSELVSKLCLDKYSTLNGSQLLGLLNEYTDALIITDTKYAHIEILRTLVAEAEQQCPSVLERIIPYIASPHELCELHQIYNFRDYILALYRIRVNNNKIVEFVKDCHISTVMMSWNSRYTDEFKEELSRVGAVTYVYSLNDPKIISSFKQRGVGVYSDSYYPEQEYKNSSR